MVLCMGSLQIELRIGIQCNSNFKYRIATRLFMQHWNAYGTNQMASPHGLINRPRSPWVRSPNIFPLAAMFWSASWVKVMNLDRFDLAQLTPMVTYLLIATNPMNTVTTGR